MLTSILALLLQAAAPAAPPSPSDPLPADWAAVPDDEVVVFTLADGGTVSVRLAPAYAPQHVANVRRLVAARWWDQGTSQRTLATCCGA